MLTRLKVSGFKNLVDVDVTFGPFTCIAGANGVGKSNLFDAIRFLNALSRVSLLEAATEVRGGRTADLRDLFHKVGEQSDPEMHFEAEMIVPTSGEDALGQTAEASATYLRYKLSLSYRSSDGGLEITHEELVYIRKGDARQHLAFPVSKEWLDSVIVSKRTVAFISTTSEKPVGERVIYLHQDRGKDGSGKPAPRLAHTLPRTVIQAANASENRTAVIARREMQSWRLLRLEPLSLREPSAFNDSSRLSERGDNLPTVLARLAAENEEQIYSIIANRLSELVAEVKTVGVERDIKRELLTIWAKGEDGTSHTARSLSEGTLRFLALAALEQDPETQGLLCLEEPENGINPERVPAMLRLLQEIAVDVSEPVRGDNPLRQVIINTHSPAVVAQVPDDTLLLAELKETVRNSIRFRRVSFGSLSDTWRADSIIDKSLIVTRGKMLAYLNPVENLEYHSDEKPIVPKEKQISRKAHSTRRVVDRDDMQMLLPFHGNLK